MSTVADIVQKMERIKLGYSTKNIPLSNERGYKLQMLNKIEAVIKRMRWKAIFFDPSKNNTKCYQETYNLKSANCPKQVKELIPFENDLMLLLKNIKFRRTKCTNFQALMKENIKDIRNSGHSRTE